MFPIIFAFHFQKSSCLPLQNHGKCTHTEDFVLSYDNVMLYYCNCMMIFFSALSFYSVIPGSEGCILKSYSMLFLLSNSCYSSALRSYIAEHSLVSITFWFIMSTNILFYWEKIICFLRIRKSYSGFVFFNSV